MPFLWGGGGGGGWGGAEYYGFPDTEIMFF